MNDERTENQREPRARATDPETSFEAARKVKPLPLRERIVAALQEAGADGLTTEEMADMGVGLLQSITPRMVELADRELARKTHMTRKGRSGAWREVWVSA